MSGLWYVIQTMTGQEEQVVELIEKMVPKSCFQECFYIRRECAAKIESNTYKVYLAPQFPGYVFVVTGQPEQLFYELRQIPKLTKILRDDEQSFLQVREEEQRFLEKIQDIEVQKEQGCNSHIIRRSLVHLDEEGIIIAAEGAVGICFNQMVRQRIRKRYVLVEQEILKRKRSIMLGIKLQEDIEIE